MALPADLSATQSVPVANLNCDDLGFDIAVYEILAQNTGLNGAAASRRLGVEGWSETAQQLTPCRLSWPYMDVSWP
ncbi:hypothetical protein AB0E10_40640 [Streptomyces sp. NPDC048045]|uniref:hypothetical protein n=1 Tax=Streptomyces sp. NPDC048045 TaxID=3154710 RepID=UPI0034492BF4